MRGAKSGLNQHRLWLGGEARYHFLSRLYAFVRLAPALLNTQATLSDPIAEAEREAGGWGFGGGRVGRRGVRGPRQGEVGSLRTVVAGSRSTAANSWAESEELSFSVSEDDSAPTRTASLELGDLALRGGFFRVGVAVTF